MKSLFKITSMMFFMFFYGEVFSQEKKTGFISLESGLSVPLGDYASTEPKNESQYAITGVNLKLNFGYYFIKKLSVIGSVGYTTHYFNEKDLANDFIQNHGNSIYYDLTPKSTTVSATPSQHLFLTAGLYYTLPIGKMFSINTRTLFGVNYSNSSSINLTTHYNDPSGLNQLEDITITSGSSSTFINLIGIDFKISGNRISSYLGFEVISTKYDYTSEYFYSEVDDSYIYYTETGTDKVSQPLNWVNINLGLSIKLGKSK